MSGTGLRSKRIQPMKLPCDFTIGWCKFIHFQMATGGTLAY